MYQPYFLADIDDNISNGNHNSNDNIKYILTS